MMNKEMKIELTEYETVLEATIIGVRQKSKGETPTVESIKNAFTMKPYDEIDLDKICKESADYINNDMPEEEMQSWLINDN